MGCRRREAFLGLGLVCVLINWIGILRRGEAPLEAPMEARLPEPLPSFATMPFNEGDGGRRDIRIVEPPAVRGGVRIVMGVVPMAATPGSVKDVAQRNAVRSLLALGRAVDVVLFLEPELQGTNLSRWQFPAELGTGRLLAVPLMGNSSLNPFGTPFVSALFQTLTTVGSGNAHFYGYANADLIFSNELVVTVQLVLHALERGMLGHRVLMIGRRFNVDAIRADVKLVRTPSEVDLLVDRLKPLSEIYHTSAIDYFLVNDERVFDWTKIPDFVIGRPGYDNFLPLWAGYNGVSVVDATATISAIHLTDEAGNSAGFSPKGRGDVDWNLSRFPPLPAGSIRRGFTDVTQYETTDRGLERRQFGDSGIPIT